MRPAPGGDAGLLVPPHKPFQNSAPVVEQVRDTDVEHSQDTSRNL